MQQFNESAGLNSLEEEGEVGGRRDGEGEEEEGSMGVGPLGRQRKFTMGERSMPSFRKSFIDVRVAIDVPCASSSSSSSMYKMLH